MLDKCNVLREAREDRLADAVDAALPDLEPVWRPQQPFRMRRRPGGHEGSALVNSHVVVPGEQRGNDNDRKRTVLDPQRWTPKPTVQLRQRTAPDLGVAKELVYRVPQWP